MTVSVSMFVLVFQRVRSAHSLEVFLAADAGSDRPDRKRKDIFFTFSLFPTCVCVCLCTQGTTAQTWRHNTLCCNSKGVHPCVGGWGLFFGDRLYFLSKRKKVDHRNNKQVMRNHSKTSIPYDDSLVILRHRRERVSCENNASCDAPFTLPPSPKQGKQLVDSQATKIPTREKCGRKTPTFFAWVEIFSPGNVCFCLGNSGG